MRLFYWLRVRVKLLLRRHALLDSFCKHCGRQVHDFVVPDSVWLQVARRIRVGNVLCYDCFCEACVKVGLPGVWVLERLPWDKGGERGKS